MIARGDRPVDPDPHETHPLDQYPLLRINGWEKYQTDTGDSWMRVYTAILVEHKFAVLTNAEFGMLLRIWLYRKATGAWPPRDPAKLRPSLVQGPSKHFSGTLKKLELRGFLLPIRKQREKEREILRGRRTNPSPAPPLTGVKFPRPETDIEPEEVLDMLETLRVRGVPND